jgi:hypothetical protein
MKPDVIAATLILLGAISLACADQGLQGFEPPTPTPTPEPQRLHLNWAEEFCGFAPVFEEVLNAWDQALEVAPPPAFEALGGELLRQVSFDLFETTASMTQWHGLLYRATTSDSEWFGRPASTAPPGVAEYERAIFELFRDFEPVLHNAEEEIRQAKSIDDLEATHASVSAAHEQMMASVREATTSLDPAALLALQSVNECGFFLGPTN